MSFSSDTKKELCKAPYANIACIKAECYGFLLFCKKFKKDSIILTTENSYVAGRFSELLTSAWQVIVEKQSVLTSRHGGSNLFTITVPDTKDCEKIFSDLGHMESQVSLRINRGNFDDDESISCFLRGAFLACGSVIDPQKDYHLEFNVTYKNLCADLIKFISDVTELFQVPKIVNRKGSYIVYLKDSEQISDFLAFIGAPIASMSIIETKILKEIRNTANRKANSEVANIKKTVSAAMEQIKAIENIRDKRGLDFLTDDLKAVCILRLENPELSLRDLGAMLNPPISRSGVNHRIKRIMQISQDISKNSR